MKVNEYRQGNSIYIWRIVFTVLIMVMHFNNVYSKIYENQVETGILFSLYLTFCCLSNSY